MPRILVYVSRISLWEGCYNRALYRALASHGDEEINFRSAEQPSPLTLSQHFGAASGTSSITISSLTDSDAAVLAGTSSRSALSLKLAWERGFRHGHRPSLVGLIHTLAPPKVREPIARC